MRAIGLAVSISVSLACGARRDDLAPSEIEAMTPSEIPTAARPAAGSPAVRATPEVPPLQPGEAPPIETPNYFEPEEMSSGGIAAGFLSCQSAASKSSPDLSTELVERYCVCVVDALRRNARTSGDHANSGPTVDQVQRCGAAARSDNASPFAFASPRSTAEEVKMWLRCMRAKDGHGPYCECFVDAVLAAMRNPNSEVFSHADDQRCVAVDAYWSATKKHLTVRQFQALAGDAAK
jgi:hypothetical protein